jgi:hypothetical protein
MSEPVNIRYLLEIQDRNIFKASVNQKIAIVDLIPRKKIHKLLFEDRV